MIPTNWDNSTQVTSDIQDFGQHNQLITATANNVFRSLLNTSLTALGQAKNAIKYYSFKNKYLNDIIDTVINGATPNPSNVVLTSDTNNNITAMNIIYDNRIVLITYNYIEADVERLQKRGAIYTLIDTTQATLLNSFTIDIVNSGGALIHRLATVQINRSYSIYFNQYLSDYIPVNGPDDPSNILSDYKYYRSNLITGWTVS